MIKQYNGKWQILCRTQTLKMNKKSTLSLSRPKFQFSTLCHMFCMILALRIWCCIRQYPLIDIFFLLNTLLSKTRMGL